MLRWGLFLVTVVGALAVENVRVGDKWTTFIPSQLKQGSETWTLTADAGSTIKIFCPDARFSSATTQEEKCRSAKLIFDDGVAKQTFCGTQYDLLVVGKSSKMTFQLIMSSSGMLECEAKAVRPPKSYEEVTVPKSGIYRFSFPEVRGNENDKAWRFKSPSSKKISLQCTVQSDKLQNACIKEIVTVDNGQGPKEQCGYDDVVAISSGKVITLRFETYPTTNSGLSCKVQTISGPSPNESENAKITVEDSSEHGVASGKKRTTCDCGRANRQSSRIINGTEAYEGKYPFMVSLRGLDNEHFCGATILSPVHILTAAHCVSDKTKSQPKPEELMPTVGVHSRGRDASHGQTQKLRVKKVSIPKQWFAGPGLGGDIALLHLATPIKFSKWVSPICLTPTEPDIIYKTIKHMGWGWTGKDYPDKLRETNTQVLDKGDCNDRAQEVCFKNEYSSACFGDSGGPFVFVDPETNRYTQVALASYVYSECYGDYFIGTNVVHWYDWIKNTMAESSMDQICRKVD